MKHKILKISIYSSLLFLIFFIAKHFCNPLMAQEFDESILFQTINLECRDIVPGSYIFNSSSEFNNTVKNNYASAECYAYKHPEIEFNEYTLLGYDLFIGGCE